MKIFTKKEILAALKKMEECEAIDGDKRNKLSVKVNKADSDKWNIELFEHYLGKDSSDRFWSDRIIEYLTESPRDELGLGNNP